MIKFVLMDIEGTTSSIDFVHKVLFPYSYEKMDTFIRTHQSEERVQKALDAFKAQLPNGKSDLSLSDLINQAKQMILDDVKYGPLKTLQGFIWQQGYTDGDIKGHVYPEVPACLQAWANKGIKLGIYSSGSVLAQKLIFGFSDHGDLTKYLSYFFDTTTGPKKESQSYQKIAKEINCSPENILFLSDSKDELAAAKKAQFNVAFVSREKNDVNAEAYKKVETFEEISL